MNAKQLRFVDPFQSSFLDRLMSISMAQFLCTSKHFSLVVRYIVYCSTVKLSRKLTVECEGVVSARERFASARVLLACRICEKREYQKC